MSYSSWDITEYQVIEYDIIGHVIYPNIYPNTWHAQHQMASALKSTERCVCFVMRATATHQLHRFEVRVFALLWFSGSVYSCSVQQRLLAYEQRLVTSSWHACRRACRRAAGVHAGELCAFLPFSGSPVVCTLVLCTTHALTSTHLCAHVHEHIRITSTAAPRSQLEWDRSCQHTRLPEKSKDTHYCTRFANSLDYFSKSVSKFFSKKKIFLFEKKPFPPEGTLMSESKEMLLTNLVTRLRRWRSAEKVSCIRFRNQYTGQINKGDEGEVQYIKEEVEASKEKEEVESSKEPAKSVPCSLAKIRILINTEEDVKQIFGLISQIPIKAWLGTTAHVRFK